ncbi:hypothetical protein PybrP1_005145 [[Pythium] brassicae (nom. inval.)]|nr:hypothetical protein PybrP1_005145 [[Pythium] brassicae (nom. inval.)]
MSIHRSQMLLMRPQTAKLGFRGVAASSTRKMHAQALSLHLPARPAIMTHRPVTIAISGAALAAAVAALTREAALSQQALFDLATGPTGSGGSGGKGKKDDAYVDWLVEQVTSRLGDISLGTGLGFCSGYALKQVGKVAAVTVGALFVLAQVASAKGYVDINWKKVEKDVITAVDPDGDGKITKKDFKIWLDRLLATLKYNLPSSAGFSAGFVLGITCS